MKLRKFKKDWLLCQGKFVIGRFTYHDLMRLKELIEVALEKESQETMRKDLL